MSNLNPNRVSVGKKGAGQFDYKQNSEADIDLEDTIVDSDVSDYDEDAEFGGHWQSDHETLMEVESDYMADIEANPSAEGLTAAVAKYRKEIKRFEVALQHRGASPSQFPGREWWNVPKGHRITVDEEDSDAFCLSAAIIEMKAVDRINEIRNQKLTADYGKYRGEFHDGPDEIEITTNTEYGNNTATVGRKRDSYAVTPSIQSGAVNEVNEVVAKAKVSDTGAAYLIARKFDSYNGEPEFYDVLVTPSTREIERLDLDNKAINEGWL